MLFNILSNLVLFDLQIINSLNQHFLWFRNFC